MPRPRASTARCARTTSPHGVCARANPGYAWSWLGAALARTSFSFGVVTAPGQRYHPVDRRRRRSRTLEEMFPGRFWACLGSGEAMNEHVTGDPWPPKGFRDDRLDESHDIIARLLAGEEVSHDGTVRVHRARCGAGRPSRRRCSRPRSPPRPPRTSPRGPTDSSPSRRTGRRSMTWWPPTAGPEGEGPSRCRRTCALAEDEETRPGHRPRPVAARCGHRPATLGRRAARGLRRRGRGRGRRDAAEVGAHRVGRARPGRPDRGAGRRGIRSHLPPSRRQGAGGLHRTRASASCSPRSGSCCREDHRHGRPVVEDRRRLLPRHRDLSGRERRRDRRPRRPRPPHRLPRRPRESPACG